VNGLFAILSALGKVAVDLALPTAGLLAGDKTTVSNSELLEVLEVNAGRVRVPASTVEVWTIEVTPADRLVSPSSRPSNRSNRYGYLLTELTAVWCPTRRTKPCAIWCGPGKQPRKTSFARAIGCGRDWGELRSPFPIAIPARTR